MYYLALELQSIAQLLALVEYTSQSRETMLPFGRIEKLRTMMQFRVAQCNAFRVFIRNAEWSRNAEWVKGR